MSLSALSALTGLSAIAGGEEVVRLPAPTNLEIEVDTTVVGTFTEVVGADSYERQYTGGDIIPFATASGFEDPLPEDDGTYTVQVRAVDVDGIRGRWATSDPFTVDTTEPTFVSAAWDTTLTVTLSEPTNGHADITLAGEHGAITPTYVSGDGGTSLVKVFSTSRTPYLEEVITINFTPGDIEDLAGNAMEAFTGQTVTHSSTEPVPEGIAADMALDFSAATPGGLLTTAILGTAKIGGSGYTPGYVFGGEQVALERTTLETDATAPVYATPFLIGATLYDGDGTLVIVTDHTSRNGDDHEWEGYKFTPSSEVEENLAGCDFVMFGEIGDVAGSSRIDHVRILQGGDFVIAGQQEAGATGAGMVKIHTEGGTGNGATVTAGVYYRRDWRANVVDGFGELMLRDPDTGAIALAARLATVMTGFTSFDFPDYLDCYRGETRRTPPVIGVGANATFPMGPSPTLANPSAPSAAQTDASEVTLTLDNPQLSFTRKIERQKNAGAWTTLEAAYTASSLVDTDLTDGDEVTYRRTDQINGFSSAAVTSNTVTVDDSVSLVVDEDFEGTGAPAGFTNTPFGGVDYDYTADPISGTQSLQIGGISDPASVLVTLDDDLTAGAWVKVRFRVDVDPANFNTFLQIIGTSDEAMVQVVRLADGTVSVLDKDGWASADTTATVNVGTKYYGWVKYLPESTPGAHDAIVRFCFNTADSMPTSGANFAQSATGRVNEDIKAVRLNVSANRGTWVFDELQISGSAFE